MSNLQITELNENDWQVYKTLRLTSLRDTPEAFGSSYERESKYSEKEWRSRLVPNNKLIQRCSLVAMINGAPVGLVMGVVHFQSADKVHVYQMWVSKSHRGLGIGRSLLSGIQDWAEQLDMKAITLEVSLSNNQAASLYKSYGFVPTGNHSAMNEDSDFYVQPMMLELK